MTSLPGTVRHNQAQRVFDDIETIFNSLFKDSPLHFVRQQNEGYPVSNILIHKDGSFKIEVAITGFSEEDIEVNLDERTLIIRGGMKETEDSKEYEDFTFVHRRIKKNKFEKQFICPKELDINNIKVTARNGLLTIDIPFDKDKKNEKKLIINK